MEEEEGRAGAPVRIFNQQMHHVDRYFILSDDMLRGFDFRSFFFLLPLYPPAKHLFGENFSNRTRDLCRTDPERALRFFRRGAIISLGKIVASSRDRTRTHACAMRRARRGREGDTRSWK